MHTVWAWRMLVVQGCWRCCNRMLAGIFSPLRGRKGTYCQLLKTVSKATSSLRHNQRQTTNNQTPSNKDECLANPIQNRTNVERALRYKPHLMRTNVWPTHPNRTNVGHAIVLIRLLVFKIGSREEDGCVPSGNGRRELEVPSIALRGLRGRPARMF